MAERPADPRPIGRRGALLLAIAAAGVAAWIALGLSPSDLVPSAGGAAIAREFFSAALTPALTYEAEQVPAGAAPFLLKVLEALGRTVIFAAAAMSLALLCGLPDVLDDLSGRLHFDRRRRRQSRRCRKGSREL